MTLPSIRYVQAPGARLAFRTFGNYDAPPLVMAHGMQDVGATLDPVAKHLAQTFCVHVLDLRGHGDSGQPGIYALSHFVYDMVVLLDHLGLEKAAFWGHSLGGQVLTRFAAMFPDRISMLVAAEGLGPPHFEGRYKGEPGLAGEGRRLEQIMQTRPRALPSKEFAAERLLANNPRLSESQAHWIATVATRQLENGELHWAFDMRVRMVFAGAEDSYRFWPNVLCPTLLVFGAHAHEYWAKVVAPKGGWDGKFATGELDARVAKFPNARATILNHSGHMVHHDEPDRLAAESLSFLTEMMSA